MATGEHEDFVAKSVGELGGYGSVDPKDWAPLFIEAGNKYGVPPRLLQALVMHESGGNHALVGSAGEQGGAQIMPGTQSQLGIGQANGKDPFDPRVFIPAAAQYLRAGYDDSAKAGNPSWDYALRYYNGGPGGPTSSSTAEYPRLVAAKYSALGGSPQSDLGIKPPIPTITVKPSGGAGITPSSASAPNVDDFVQGAVGEIAGLPTENEDEARAKLAQAIADQAKKGAVPAAGNAATGVIAPEDITNKLTANTGPDLASPAPAQVPGGTVGLSSPGAGPQLIPPPALPQQTPSAQWNGLSALGNGLTLGAGPAIAAAGGTARAGLSALLGGMPLSTVLQAAPQVFSQAYGDASQARQNYNAQNPTTGMLGETAGSLVPTMLGLGFAGKAVAGAAPMLAPEPGAFATRLGGMLRGAAGNPTGSMLARLPAQVATGALQGAAGGAMTSGLNSQDPIGDAFRGGGIGAALGLALGPLGTTLNHVLNAPVAPGLIDAASTKAADAVGIRGGQIGQGSLLKTLDRALSGDADTVELAKFSQELGKELGITGGDLPTQSAFNKAQLDTGKMFDDVATRIGMQMTPKIGQRISDLVQKATDYAQLYPESGKPIIATIKRVFQNIVTSPGMKLSGQDFRTLTSFDGPVGILARADNSNESMFDKKLKDILYEGLSDTAQVQGNPQDVASLAIARKQWFNQLMVEPIIEKNSSGVLDPKKVLNAASNRMDGFADPGQNTVTDLAKLAPILPTPSAQGDVSKPINLARAARHLIETKYFLGGLAGMAGGAEALGAPTNLMVGGGLAALTGFIGAKGVQKYMMSPAFKNRLIQAASGAANPIGMPAFMTNALTEMTSSPPQGSQ